MKHLITATLFFLSTNNAAGQQCYSINYERKIVTNLHDVEYTGTITARLIFDDTLSFFYFFPEFGKDVSSNIKAFEKKLKHHSIFYNRNNNELLHVVNLSASQRYLAVDTPKIYDWVYTTETKKIEGYNCNLAFTINQGDTIVAWYCNEIGSIFGPSAYIGLPGVILEIVDQRYAYHFVAKKIEKCTVSLMLPTKYKRLTFEQHLKKIR